MSDLSADWVRIAAKRTGLRIDQVTAAIVEYRNAGSDICAEPEWQAIMHMSGPCYAIAQYGSAETSIVMDIESTRANKDANWKQHPADYVIYGKPYASFAEARQIELEEIAAPAPREVIAI